ncbi:hypothetical protein [Streptomyces sp. NBC_00268]|uniref:hypothetical protein n=1 Tax=Streptomyces sp. NBC_00268 TaxID=2975695 RepID=UPI00224CF536|nr:hypothetical protein [Streptomyces sp. NBC_00268]MCX5182635.1 hypothetical protein [Streptomyces sp. NBC_00268]
MTTATTPLSPETGRSHLQESLFSWLEPEPAPKPRIAKPAPVTAPVVTAETKTLEESGPEGSPVAPALAKDLSHVWVVAAEIEVTPKIASVADYRGSFKTTEEQRVDALEVYCKGCRRPYDEVKGQDCAEKIDNRHLIGGDQSVRAKRKVPVPPPNAKIISGGTINRRGLGAYVSGVSRPPR